MNLRKLSLMIFLSIVAAVIVTLIGIGSYRKSQIEKIKNSTRINLQDGVSESFYADINGSEQWFLTRGYNRSNPVMLFIHGGPGKPESNLRHLLQNQLEKHVTVVHWDQRGAGRSYDSQLDYADLTPEVFLADTQAVVDMLCKRYQKQQLFLLGHSWGSYLAMKTAAKLPQKVAGVIGVGQVVHFTRGLEYSLAKLQQLASGQDADLRQLQALGRPPYDMNQLAIYTRFLYQYGGELAQSKGYSELVKQSYFSPEYRWIDHLNWVKGQMKSAQALLPSLYTIDLFSEVPSLQVPVTFFVGRHDLNTPAQLVVEYERMLNAPEKDIVWFTDSAHSPNFEEPLKFQRAVRRFIYRHRTHQM